MNEFVTFKDEDSEGNLQYYILQRAFPHYCGMIKEAPPTKVLGYSAVSGYGLYIVFANTLRGNVIPSYRDVQQEIQGFCDTAAQWFLDHRILTDEKRYKKFKINDGE